MHTYMVFNEDTHYNRKQDFNNSRKKQYHFEIQSSKRANGDDFNNEMVKNLTLLLENCSIK